MSSYNYLLSIFIISLFIGACDKDPIIPDDPDPPSETIPKAVLDTLWTLRLFEWNELSYRNKLYLHEDELYTTVSTQVRGFDNYIAKIDIEKGKLMWETSARGLENVSGHIYHDRIILKDWKKYAAYSLSNGKTIQRNTYGEFPNPRGNFISKYIYFSDDIDDQMYTELYRAEFNNLSTKEHIYTLEEDVYADSWKSIESVNGYIDSETGHEMLVFQHRMHQLPTGNGRIDFVFYDVTDRKVTKIHKDIEPNGNSSVAQILIVEDKAYFQGSNTIYCFDLNTQEMVWHQRYLGEKFTSFGSGRLEHAEDLNLIIIKSDGNRLIAFDPNTGEEKWVNTESRFGGAPITYYDGYVYYINNNKLRIHDAMNGEFVMEKRTPLDSREYFGTKSKVIIDPERKLMFVASYNVIFCSELLPKRE